MKILFIFLLSFLYVNSFASENFTKEEIQWIKDNTVKISIMNNFLPFSYVEKDETKGLTFELLNKISQDTGLKLEIKTSIWPVAIDNFKNKKTDMIADIAYAKHRESFTLYTKPYYEIPHFIYGSIDEKNYIDNTSLKGKKVAVLKDIFYIPKLKELGIKIVEIESYSDFPRALLDGKVDYYITSYTTGMKILNEQSITNIKPLDEVKNIEKDNLRFGINPDKPILHSIMKKSLENIPMSFLSKLINKWVIFKDDNPNEKLQLSDEEKEFIAKYPIVKYSTKDWQPIFSMENNIAKGIVSDYLKIIEKRTGLEFQYIQVQGMKERHKKLDDGTIDIIPAIKYNGDFKSKYLQSNFFVQYPMVIITNNQYKYIEDLSELNGKTVAMINMPPALKYLSKKYPNVKIKKVSSIPDALLLLENNGIDAFVGHIAPAIHNLNQLNQKSLKISGTVDFEYKHMFLINPDKQELVSIINKAINSIETFQKSDIYAKWVKSVSTEKIIDYSLFYKFGFFFLIIIAILVYRHYELRKINKALKNSNFKIESILNSTLEGLIISENLKIAKVNIEMLKILGYKEPKDLIGKKLYDVIAENSRASVRNKVETKDLAPYEINLLRADGSIFPALAKGRDIFIDNKTIRISSLVDISDMKNQEKLFLQQSKMAALGEMIGNIAHQWRQPLSLITTSASGLKLKKDYKMLEDKDIDEISDSILESANYLSKIIDDFDNYLRGEKKLEYFYINDVIKANINFEKEICEKYDIKLIFSNVKRIEINGYKSEILQVIQNILNNAIDALKKVHYEKAIFIKIYEESQSVVIEIQDNAGGIPKDIIAKVYEPYFTTKHQSQGTGLGLYMTYNILKDMNSEIKVENKDVQYNTEYYQGANFKIIVPKNFESQNL